MLQEKVQKKKRVKSSFIDSIGLRTSTQKFDPPDPFIGIRYRRIGKAS